MSVLVREVNHCYVYRELKVNLLIYYATSQFVSSENAYRTLDFTSP